jgi:hypothetical protein
MKRRIFVKRFAATAVIAGWAGCVGSSPSGGDEVTAETQAVTTSEAPAGTTTEAQTGSATERHTETADEGTTTAESTGTDDNPPDIPKPGTPPLSAGTPTDESADERSGTEENARRF